jgi:hypothetical protein
VKFLARERGAAHRRHHREGAGAARSPSLACITAARFVDDPDMKLDQSCYIVREANGQALAYVYFEEEPGRRSAAHLMTRDEARRIVTLLDGSLLPAPITRRPHLVVKKGFRDIGVCRVILGGRRDICRRRWLRGRWEVIPGTEGSTLPLTRRSPLRVVVVIRDVGHSMMHLYSPRRVAGWQIVWRAGM